MSNDEAGQGAKSPKWPWIVGLLILLGIGFYAKLGFYSIQPIGAVPDGATAIVWREDGEPFFNSADGLCLERVGEVSLMCRAMAAGQAPTDRIVMRLPYQRWAYLQSTGGKEFDR
jgi:hypothetical protein